MKEVANHQEQRSSYTQVLSHANFRALWFGQICSQLAGNTLLFVLALRVYESTTSNTAVSGLFMAYGIPAVLFGIIAGTLVDRLDRRRILMFCDFLRALMVLVLMFLSHNVLFVYGITFINAMITQFYVPSEAPLIPKIVPKERLVTANSMFSFTFYTSMAVGSILAGPLLRLFGTQGIFIFIAVLFFLASYFSSRIPSQKEGTVGFRTIFRYNFGYLVVRIWTSLVEGIRYISSSKPLTDAITLLTGTQIVLVMLGTLGPGFADRVLRIDIRDASLFMVGPAVLGIILGALWVGMIGYRYTSTRLIRVGSVAVGVLLVVIALTVRMLRIGYFDWLYTSGIVYPFEILLFFFLGVANSLLDVPANSILQEKARGSLRGRVYGVLTAFIGGVGMIPILIGGVLADTIGVGKVLLFLGILVCIYSGFRIRYNK
jgi:MFS family permease